MTPGADWPDQARRLAETLVGVLGTPSPHDGDAAGDGAGEVAECRWCPLCQLIAVLRGERPEVTAVLADVLRTTADALHAFAAAAGPDGPAPAGPADDEEAGPPVGDRTPLVQRIEIA